MDKIDLVYIGPKRIKHDTLTGSHLLFPRGKSVPTPADIAQRMLQHPTVWIEADKVADWRKREADEAEAVRLAAEAALLREEEERKRRDMNCGDYGDIGKFTAAQLRTLVEGAELDIPQQSAQEKVDDFRLRVRDALREKLAAEGDA
ncbi:hypothetical protein ACHHZ2_12510 [Citrobacter freundii complex sp. 2024EL-00237]|uniref:hypothetical protein n=1 Tax=Citrobacter freundii complex TaxID=1344959 RepID=UPI00229583AF|nr:hypothetical protein [Citrobacter freundii]HCJ7774569.1 hypothetical protein [Citrobacter freundii]HCT4952807.1 hypothetical protein [Citrobacter freundii]HEI8706012.1 hypothetical protein [Citrobacter freundii]